MSSQKPQQSAKLWVLLSTHLHLMARPRRAAARGYQPGFVNKSMTLLPCKNALPTRENGKYVRAVPTCTSDTAISGWCSLLIFIGPYGHCQGILCLYEDFGDPNPTKLGSYASQKLVVSTIPLQFRRVAAAKAKV